MQHTLNRAQTLGRKKFRTKFFSGAVDAALGVIRLVKFSTLTAR
jgi:hypothetical protein